MVLTDNPSVPPIFALAHDPSNRSAIPEQAVSPRSCPGVTTSRIELTDLAFHSQLRQQLGFAVSHPLAKRLQIHLGAFHLGKKLALFFFDMMAYLLA